MKSLRLLIILQFTIFALPLMAQSQQQEYDLLVEELKILRNRQDSTQKQIDKNRQLLENRPDNKEAYSKAIIKLEDLLYDINAGISKVGAKVLAMESSLPIKKQSEVQQPKTANSLPSKESANLFRNYFFMTNLSKEDQATISSTAKAEIQAKLLISQIEPLYVQLTEIKQAYEKAQTPRMVDELRTKAMITKGQIKEIDDEIDRTWGRVFRFKTDKYPVLIDRLSGVDRLQLETIDNDMRQVRRAESIAASQEAPSAVIFPLQKELTLHYEQLLASNLELRLATDSLAKQVALMPKTKYEFPFVEFAPRILVVYSDVVMDGKYDFNSVDSIPELIVPNKGIYYAVGVATMPNKPTALSFFRGGRPLHYVKLDNGMTQYVLGGYRTYDEAQQSVTKLQKAGYRAPVIAAWVDGVYTAAPKAKAVEQERGTVSSSGYNVEVRTTNQAVSSSLREVVDMHAKGKQISRVQNGSELIFTISGFSVKDEAEVIAEILRTKGNTKVSVIEIE